MKIPLGAIHRIGACSLDSGIRALGHCLFDDTISCQTLLAPLSSPKAQAAFFDAQQQRGSRKYLADLGRSSISLSLYDETLSRIVDRSVAQDVVRCIVDARFMTMLLLQCKVPVKGTAEDGDLIFCVLGWVHDTQGKDAVKGWVRSTLSRFIKVAASAFHQRRSRLEARQVNILRSSKAPAVEDTSARAVASVALGKRKRTDDEDGENVSPNRLVSAPTSTSPSSSIPPKKRRHRPLHKGKNKATPANQRRPLEAKDDVHYTPN